MNDGKLEHFDFQEYIRTLYRIGLDKVQDIEDDQTRRWYMKEIIRVTGEWTKQMEAGWYDLMLEGRQRDAK